MIETIRIATRESRLALWQAHHVAERLRLRYPELQTALVPMTTKGDQILHTTLAKIGGKGLFIKELETAMLEGRADIAVHSMKDVPAEMPAGLDIAAVLERADPRDAFVSNDYPGARGVARGRRAGHLQPAAPGPAETRPTGSRDSARAGQRRDPASKAGRG